MVTYSYNEIVCSNKTDQSNDVQQKMGKQSHKHFVLNLRVRYKRMCAV